MRKLTYMLIGLMALFAGLLVAKHFGVEMGPLAYLAPFVVFGITYPLPQGFPGKAMFDLTQPGGEHAEDVSPMVELFSPTATPLLYALGMATRPAQNIKHEWLEDGLIPDNVLLAAPLGANATTDVLMTVPDNSVFQIGELVAIGTPPHVELIEVTGLRADGVTLDVTRGYGSSVAIAHASGEEILLMGEHSIEGDDAPNSQKTNMDRPFNICQIFNYKIEMTGTRQALIPFHLGDIGDEWAYEKRKRMIEAMRDLEARVLMSDWRTAAGFQGSSTQARTMRGIYWYLNSGNYYGGAAHLPPANCFANAGGVQFTFNNFRTMMQQAVYQNGAEEGQANLLLIPPALKVSVSRWKEAAMGTMVTQTGPGDDLFAQYVNRIMTDFGPVDVIMHPRLRKFGNVAILLSRKYVKAVNLIGRSFFTIPLGATGDRREEELVGEYTLEMQGVDKGFHCLVYNWIPIP